MTIDAAGLEDRRDLQVPRDPGGDAIVGFECAEKRDKGEGKREKGKGKSKKEKPVD